MGVNNFQVKVVFGSNIKNISLILTVAISGLLLHFDQTGWAAVISGSHAIKPPVLVPPIWPNYGHFWALVTKVGASVQPEFAGCYAKVLIVYMDEKGALKQEAAVLTKDNNICTIMQTAYETHDQGEFRGNLRSDLPPPVVEGIGAVKPVYDLLSICVYC